MKFVTEMELRDLYKIEPFTTFLLEPDTRITPGAKQFLTDRRIILEMGAEKKAVNRSPGSEPPQQEAEQKILGSRFCQMRLQRKMEYIESLFLIIAADLLHSGGAILSEDILALGRCFKNVRLAEKENIPPDKIQFWGWQEAEIKKRAEAMGDEAVDSDFRVDVDRGREIALLNYLRASIRETEPAILEAYWQEERQECLRMDLVDAIYLIADILAIMMKKCMGGQKWKR